MAVSGSEDSCRKHRTVKIVQFLVHFRTLITGDILQQKPTRFIARFPSLYGFLPFDIPYPVFLIHRKVHGFLRFSTFFFRFSY
jgi:hypothetical protein